MKGGGQDMTFFEVYDRWLDEHKAEVKQTTVAAYLNDRNTFLVLSLMILTSALLTRTQ